MATVENKTLIRYEQTNKIINRSIIRYTQNGVISKTLIRYAQKKTVENKTLIRYSQQSESFLKEITQPISDKDYSNLFYDTEQKSALSNRVSVRLKLYQGANTYNFTNFLKDIQITRRKNDIDTWTFTLQDDSSKSLSPKNTSSSYYGLLFVDFYQSTWTLKKYLVLEVQQGDNIWISNKLIILDYLYNSKSRNLTISGADKCKHLFTSNQNMDPWENATAKTIIADILEEYGITSYTLNFEDYKVKEFNFVNTTPIERIQALLYVGMATWYYRGDRFYAVSDNYKTSGYDWKYKDRVNIYDLTYHQSLNDYYNEINMGRTTKQDVVCIIEGDEFGFHKETLCSPMKKPVFNKLYSTYGDITLVYFLDESETHYLEVYNQIGLEYPAGMSPGSSSTIWTSVSFAYQQKEGLDSGSITNNGYKIRITGIGVDTDTSDDNYQYHYVDSDEQDSYGVWVYPDDVVNELIPDTDWAEELAKWILKQHSRNKELIDKIVPLNMEMYPCETFKITDYGTSLEDEYFYSEQVGIQIGNGAVRNSVSLVKYSD